MICLFTVYFHQDELLNVYRTHWVRLLLVVVVQFGPNLATESSFMLALVSWNTQSYFFVCFWALSEFLVLQDVPGFCCVFPTPAINLAISPRSPDTLYSRMVLKIKTWVIGINHLNGNTILLTKYIIVQVSMKLNNLWFDLQLLLSSPPPPTKSIIYIV